MLKRLSGVLAALSAVVVSCPATAADPWPTRPVTMIVPFAAGAASDTVGRILAASLSEQLGQQVIVENVGGAGGTTGTARAAKAPPDGYQFVLGGIDTFAMSKALYKKLPYDPVGDFVPVALVVEQPIILLVRKDMPAADLRAFIDYARANPGKLQYGSAGVGSGSHLACAQLNAAAGADAVHVPYRGSPPAMQDLIAGRIDYFCALGAAAMPQIESNSLRALAILTKSRSALLPDLASAHEQGLKDFDAPFWSAVFVPAHTPADVVQKLNGAAGVTMNSAEAQERLKKVGATVPAADRRSPDYLKRFLDAEIDKWGTIIKASGVSLD